MQYVRTSLSLKLNTLDKLVENMMDTSKLPHLYLIDYLVSTKKHIANKLKTSENIDELLEYDDILGKIINNVHVFLVDIDKLNEESNIEDICKMTLDLIQISTKYISSKIIKISNILKQQGSPIYEISPSRLLSIISEFDKYVKKGILNIFPCIDLLEIDYSLKIMSQFTLIEPMYHFFKQLIKIFDLVLINNKNL